jgi:hypothetical protein
MAVDVGTVPQWLAIGPLLTLVGLWWRRDVALRKISSSEAGDLRDHYAEELKSVRLERIQDRAEALKVEKHLREMIQLSDHRHEECEKARIIDRGERAHMQAEIDGLKLQIPRLSADALLILEKSGSVKPSEIAPHSTAAAKRLKESDGK